MSHRFVFVCKINTNIKGEKLREKKVAFFSSFFLLQMNDLEERIMLMANDRGQTKTFCPSEIARQMSSNEIEWRSYMEPVRSVAAKLIDQGRLVCKQKGQIVDIRTVKGPIRLQLVDQ